MNYYIVVLLISFVCSINLKGQSFEVLESSTPTERAILLSEEFQNNLSLTAPEYEEIEKLNIKYALKIDMILKQKKNKFFKITQIKKLNKEKDLALKLLLPSSQFDYYLEYKKVWIESVRKQLAD